MKIRLINKDDRNELFAMMREFYSSPALIHKSSDRVLNRTIDDCLVQNPYVCAYIFEEDDRVAGYSIVSKNYTTEYGGICIWIEDLFFKQEFRGRRLSDEFFSFVEKQYPEAVRYKLEVEAENEHAVACYLKHEYQKSDYFLMTKEIDKDE